MIGEFFKGDVRFISAGIRNSKYVITSNSSIIKVKNSTHIKLIQNQYDFPETFEIIAPLDVVGVISGSIPSTYIQNLPALEYLRLRQIFQGV